MDSQVHVAGEGSQSWQKAKVTSYMAADERIECDNQAKGVSPYKTIRSPETYLPPREQHGGNHPTMIQLSSTWSLPQHVGIMGAKIQYEIWVGTQRQTISIHKYIVGRKQNYKHRHKEMHSYMSQTSNT